jgi:hypothetical protein
VLPISRQALTPPIVERDKSYTARLHGSSSSTIAGVGQIEPVLHEGHPQHPLQAHGGRIVFVYFSKPVLASVGFGRVIVTSHSRLRLVPSSQHSRCMRASRSNQLPHFIGIGACSMTDSGVKIACQGC